jgi:hypothetical protein
MTTVVVPVSEAQEDNNRENRGGQTAENSEIELFWR